MQYAILKRTESSRVRSPRPGRPRPRLVVRVGPRSHPLRYGIALLCVLAASAINLSQPDIFGPGAPFILYYPAVVLAGWLGGFGPGILASLASAGLAFYLNVEPTHTFKLLHSVDATRVTVFLACCIFISALDEALRRAATALQSTEEEAARSDELLRTTIETLPVLVSFIGKDHRFIFHNQRYADWFGPEAADIRGKHMRDVLGEEAYQRVLPKLEQALDGRFVEYEAMLPYRSGPHRWVHALYVPNRARDGTVQSITALVIDASERKRVEEEIRRANATLEQRVAQRTEELRKTIDELERFTYTVAHDLRAPLRAVHRYSELLAIDHKDLPTTAQAYLRHVTSGAKKMDRLIEDLLAYSRIGRSELKPEPIDIAVLAGEVAASLSLQIQESGAEVRIAREKLPPAVADKFLLSQVLTNLVTNALKFVPPGRAPRVEIGASRRDGGVRIWVRDNGIGIDPQYRDRLFKLFERLHRQEEFPGTGIGLAIVSRAAEKMGGSVGYDSEPGKGSVFWIEFPPGQEP